MNKTALSSAHTLSGADKTAPSGMHETALSSTRTQSVVDQTALSGACDYAEAAQEMTGKRET